MTLPARANPFRTERVHQVRYRPQGVTWAALIERLQRLRYRAAIVGPHGHGKTTLLEDLRPRLHELGLRTHLLFLNGDDAPAPPPGWLDTLADLSPRDVVLVDGYDLLGPVARWRLRRRTRRAGGLIVTTHRRCALPTLVRCTTDAALLGELVDQLGQPLPAPALADLHRRHRGNLRFALRELYDRAARG